MTFTDLGSGSPQTHFVTDATSEDTYPRGIYSGETSTNTCRQGIHHLARDEYSPPKAVVFESILAASKPNIRSRRVVLRRFDVYNNYQPTAFAESAGAFGGLLAYGIATSMLSSDQAYKNPLTFEKLVVDINPAPIGPQTDTDIDAEGDEDDFVAGCVGANEGEYDARRFRGKHNVVVIWLYFDVDDMPHRFRTFYQYQAPDKYQDASPFIEKAIRLTIKAAASKLPI